MTDPGPSPPPEAAPAATTFAGKLALKQRAGGIIVPLVTVIFAFVMSGIIVAATQHSVHTALVVFKEIFDGSGLNWIAHPTTNLFNTSAYNLSQTLLQTTPLILTGLAVAFAFRCGMFNIGGNGQYLVGLLVANWLGVDLAGLNPFVHVLLCIVAGTLAAAAYAGIAGVLKATVGAHEVITTIMLNWIAYWTASWLVGAGGPLQISNNPTDPVSNQVSPSARLPDFWGVQGFQGLHVGLFISLAAVVVFWVLLNRTTLGYEVRAVGFNPDAAAYGGISVRKNYIRAMAISGAFAGLAGTLDMLGGAQNYQIGQLDIPFIQVGFIGIAVALLGRNTALGTLLGALLFGGLLYGSFHGLGSSSVIDPTLATNLTYIIQGLVVLFIGADILILYIWNSRKKLRPPTAGKTAKPAEAAS
ncbi:MAG TPA: ABC transporter permease [Gaiellaceae bacterium]|nr:ABC transporter permease [Gaiellaceae bacterium]